MVKARRRVSAAVGLPVRPELVQQPQGSPRLILRLPWAVAGDGARAGSAVGDGRLERTAGGREVERQALRRDPHRRRRHGLGDGGVQGGAVGVEQ